METYERVGKSQRRGHTETDVSLTVNIDRGPLYELRIDGVSLEEPSPMFYFNHLLQQVATHGFQTIEGEIKILDGSQHHGYEDTAIQLGRAYREAFGDRNGITRIADRTWPFEGAYVHMAVDLSTRGHSNLKVPVQDSGLRSMVNHVFETLTRESGIDLYAVGEGTDDHHLIELLGKLFGRTVYDATRYLEAQKGAPSSKGHMG